MSLVEFFSCSKIEYTTVAFDLCLTTHRRWCLGVFLGLWIALGSFLLPQLGQLVRYFAHRRARSHIWPVRCARLCLRRSSTRIREPVRGPKASNREQHSTVERCAVCEQEAIEQ